MLPHEKELVKLVQDKPFALLGINSDGDADKVKKILADNAITWRQALDVDTDGKLATKWNVNGWPTIFVLDANGVIRYRDVRDEALQKAVVDLLDEAAKPK